MNGDKPSIGIDSVVDHGDSTGLFLKVLGPLQNSFEHLLGIRIQTKLIQGECHVPSRREHRRRDLIDGNGTGSTSSRFLPSSRARLLRHPARPRCIHSGLKPPVPHRSGGGTVPVVGQETQPLMSYETPPAEKRQCRSCGTVLTLNFFRLDHLECRYCEGKRLADLRDSSSEET